MGPGASNASGCAGLDGAVTRTYREFDRRQDRRRYQVSQESQTRDWGRGFVARLARYTGGGDRRRSTLCESVRLAAPYRFTTVRVTCEAYCRE